MVHSAPTWISDKATRLLLEGHCVEGGTGTDGFVSLRATSPAAQGLTPGTRSHSRRKDGAFRASYPADFLIMRKGRANLICSSVSSLLVLGLLHKRSPP